MPRPAQIFATSGILRPAGAPSRPRSALLEHAVSLAGVRTAKVCLVPTAVGDAATHIEAFYQSFAGADHATPGHLQLFSQPNVRDVRAHLLAQDVIWVGGGSVVNLLAVWRAHRLDEIMRECWEAGVVLAGGSAGSLCWHTGGLTDSFSDDLEPIHNGLGFLPHTNGVHHDLPDQPRRAGYLAAVGSGVLAAGYATEDGTGLHYLGTELVEAVTSLETADAYRVELDAAGQAVERPLGARLL